MRRHALKVSCLVGGLRSIAVMLLVCVIGAWILTELILGGRAREEWHVFIIPLILAIGTILGSLINRSIVGNENWQITLLSGLVVGVLLLVGGMVTDGEFRMMRYNLLGLAAGYALSWLICNKKRGSTKYKKNVYR